MEIVIANSGPAIPQPLRDRIFERYGHGPEDPAHAHLGLGLYFCRIAAEAHGGTIRIEERPDFPATFVLDLPR